MSSGANNCWRNSCAQPSTADPDLHAHHLLAVLWESGRLLLVSPGEFTRERILQSLDTLITAIVGANQAAR